MELGKTNLREIAISQKSDDEPPVSMNETFQGLQIDDNLWQIRNIPAIISGISFGDVFEPRSDRPGWRLVNKSRYSTFIVGPKAHMDNVAGNEMIDNALAEAKLLPGVLFEKNKSVRCFAVPPASMATMVQLMEEGGQRFWEWALTCDRSASEN